MTLYKPEIIEKLCELVSTGSNLNQIEKMAGMPNAATVYLWLAKFPDFKERYEAARIARIETWEDEHRRRIEATPENMAALKKLDLWLKNQWFFMEKLNPKKYGQRTTLAGDKDNPLTLNLAAVLDERIAQRQTPQAIGHDIPLSNRLQVLDAEAEEIES